jgi:hypothetical protein
MKQTGSQQYNNNNKAC